MSKQEKGRGRGRGKGSIPNQVNKFNSNVLPAEIGNSSPTPQATDSVESIKKSPTGRGRGSRTPGNRSPELDSQLGNGGRSSGSSVGTVSPVPESPPPNGKEANGFKKPDFQLVSRPGFGKQGRRIELVSNYFTLNHKPQTVYQYCVDINSLDQIKKYGKPVSKMTRADAADKKMSRLEVEMDRRIGRLRCREIFGQLVKVKALESYNPVFDDARNLYTTRPLPLFSFENPVVTFEIVMESNGRSRRYEVVVQPAKKSDGSNELNFATLRKTFDGRMEMMNVLNTVMNHRSVDTQIQVGRSFFYLNQPNKTQLGEGMEIWFGYNQNVHLTQRGLAIVINLSAKAFHKAGSAIDYINDLLRTNITTCDSIRNFDIKKIEESLRGVKINVTHLPYPRKYTIQNVSTRPASQIKINMDGKEVSVADYYKMKYRPLRYPNLPCFCMKSNKPTQIPFENCTIIEGQPKLGKLSPRGTANMIRQTAIAPAQRFAAIEKSARDVRAESGEKMGSFHMSMDLQPMNVPARVIDAPALKYAFPRPDNPGVRPDHRGVWRMENFKFFRPPANIDSWILLCFDERRQMGALQKFVDLFTGSSRAAGLSLGSFLGIRKFTFRDKTEQVLKDTEKTGASFAIIVLSRTDSSHSYDEVKFIADYKLGLVTQCVDSAVLDKVNDQITSNLCLKVNTKMGGVNHVLVQRPPVMQKPVMIIGADAVHSMRDSPCPSIAAVVASMDAFPSKYKVECRVQENKNANKQSQEVILDMKAMVASLIRAFQLNVHGKHPEKIVFFRDGVSEGQFKAVVEKEVHACQQASEEVLGYIVPITYVVVQKRHQTRFRPKNPRDGVGKHGNVPPGTTVDTDVTHPDRFDYFLNSHEGIQGTSKPAHYTVLHDDNGFGADELQSLSYHLCYTYSKCNRSISIPAPVMYADLACYRAKKYADFHLQMELNRRDAHSVGSGGFRNVSLPEHVKTAINNMGSYKNSMFFV